MQTATRPQLNHDRTQLLEEVQRDQDRRKYKKPEADRYHEWQILEESRASVSPNSGNMWFSLKCGLLDQDGNLSKHSTNLLGVLPIATPDEIREACPDKNGVTPPTQMTVVNDEGDEVTKLPKNRWTFEILHRELGVSPALPEVPKYDREAAAYKLEDGTTMSKEQAVEAELERKIAVTEWAYEVWNDVREGVNPLAGTTFFAKVGYKDDADNEDNFGLIDTASVRAELPEGETLGVRA